MYEPWNALEAPRFTGPRTYARLPWVKDLAGVESRRLRAALGWRHVVSLRCAVRPRGHQVRVRDDPHLQPRAARPGVRRALDDRLRRRAHRSRLHRGDARAHGAVHLAACRSGVVGIAHGRRSLGDARRAARARPRPWPARARAPRLPHGSLGHLQRPSVLARHDVQARDHRRASSTRRACIQAGMRGSLYGEDDENIPAELGVETIPWIDLAELSPAQLRRARARLRVGGQAGVPARSTSTSWTRRFCRAPAPPRSAARRASRRCSTCALSPASSSSATTSSRSPRSTTGRAR